MNDLCWASDNEVHYMTFTETRRKPWWHWKQSDWKGHLLLKSTTREFVKQSQLMKTFSEPLEPSYVPL